MDETKRNLQIGLFVAIGVILLLSAIYFFGGRKILQKKIKLYTVFSESLQGLSTGSEVKYCGTRIGSVSKIAIIIRKKAVYVEMEVELESFKSGNADKTPSQAEVTEIFQNEIKNGMRCRMEYGGITGMKYIDCDYFDKPGVVTNPPDINMGQDAIYIPSVPSTLKDISNTVNELVRKTSELPLKEFADKLISSVDSISEILSDPNLRSLPAKLNETLENLEKISISLEQATRNNQLKDTMDNLVTATQKVNALLEQGNQMRLPETTESFRKMCDSISTSRNEVRITLIKLNESLDSLKMLADYLNKEPSSVIYGKKNKPYVFR